MHDIDFGTDTLSDVNACLRREWLETNGLGGFGSSTILGVNTRRYHGLLIAAIDPPAGRLVLLSKLEETVLVNGKHHDLGANQYPGIMYPRGFEYLTRFRFDPFPTFTYQLGEVGIEKRVFLVHGENTVVVEYEMTGGGNCTFELRPLIAFRHFHRLTRRNSALHPEVLEDGDIVTIAPYPELPALHFAHNGVQIEHTGDWYYNFEYDRERDRGLDFQEDLFNPFVARIELQVGQTVTLVASTRKISTDELPHLRNREVERRKKLPAPAPVSDPFVRKLIAASDQFLVQLGKRKTIIAGYHWFSDWGRDTMIALPGLTLVVGRFEAAREILQTFLEKLDQGMIPNWFEDSSDTPEYNSVDATLWLFEAVRSYLVWTGDVEFVSRQIYPRLIEIIDWHVRGTRFGIQVDTDGLLKCGDPGVQLTWMDSKIGDRVVTPRQGKPVEIQALWYNALRVQELLSAVVRDSKRQHTAREMAERARESFDKLFWNDPAGCLYDVVDGERYDGSIRPNQIFAISLHYTILAQERWQRVIDVVTRELFTPAGLRTLSPSDPDYQPRYDGGVNSRDSAYHQGTVWPWLMGPFITAFLKLHGRSQSAREQAAEWIQGFELQMRSNGLGQIGEIADAESPHMSAGCIAQAWSVAELLRAALEDVYAVTPAGFATV